MYARVQTGVLYGLEAEIAAVEADLSQGLPCFNIVGLADQSVREAKERIRSAVNNEGYGFPTRRITVNLAPAGRKKEGTHFDLPIAISLLAASGKVKVSEKKLQSFALIGELSLDGKVNPVSGVLPLLIGLQKSGIKRVFLPEGSMTEAMLLTGIVLYPVSRLGQVVNYFNGKGGVDAIEAAGRKTKGSKVSLALDFRDIKGHEGLKHIAVTAAAGRHGLLLVGPPGTGKTMVCQRMQGILPEMSYEEQMEVTKIYSAAGLLTKEKPIITERPFRAPHHSLSSAAFLGGGSVPKPGEISLAHRGILFLDELPEFSHRVLEHLRTPLEERAVTISRLHGNYIFPADFMIVAAMNPCRCGYLGDETHRCTCSDRQIHAYMDKISAPLLDRIDIHGQVTLNPYEMYEEKSGTGMDSAGMGELVMAAQEMQFSRYRTEGILYNSELTPALIEKYCRLPSGARTLLREALCRYRLSLRARDKVLRLARTLADLSDSSAIQEEHLAEALQYRCLDKMYRGRDGKDAPI